MKFNFGLLMTSASLCALALGGCSTSGGGFSSNAAAILASGTVDGTNGYAIKTASDSTTDPKVAAKVTYNTNGTPGLTDDTVVVAVNGGGQTAGPTTYAYSSSNPSTPGTGDYAAFYRYDPTTVAQNSILFAGAGADSFAGLVAANDPSTSATNSPANAAAFFGGNAPTALPTTGTVTYNGNAAAARETYGSASAIVGGAATIAANFATGGVTGTLLGGSTTTLGAVGFTGAMSTDHASYSALTGTSGQSVTIGNGATAAAAFGQVNGGFFGASGYQTAGDFDVQTVAGTISSTNTGTKYTGAFGATTAVP